MGEKRYDTRPSWRPAFDLTVRILSFVGGGIAIAAALGAILWFSCVGVSAGEKARRTLEKAGYTNIKLGEPEPLKCGESDGRSNSFTATNPKGSVVSGIVCCGLSGCGKGCTIRF